MTPTLQGGAQYQDLRQDTAFIAAPEGEQIQYLQEVYLPQQDPEFAKAPPQEQQQYIKEMVLPQIKQTEVMPAHGSLTQPGFDPLRELNKGLSTATLFTGAFVDPFSDAMTMGYGNSKETSEALARKQFPGIEEDKGLLGMAYRAHQNPIANFAGEMAGMVGPVNAIGSGINAGVKALGRNMLPKTTQMAQAAGVGSGFHRAMMGAATWMQSRGFGQSAARLGAELGLYEALKSQPGHQLDLGQRALHGAGGALSGAALGGAGEVVAPLIGRAVKNVAASAKELPYLLDDLKPVNLNMPRVPKRILDANAKAQKMLHDLYEGVIDAAHVDMEDIKSLGTVLDDMQYVIENGLGQKTQKNLAERANAVVGRIKFKSKIRSKFDVQKAKAKQQNRAAIQNPQGAKPSEQAAEQSQGEGKAVIPAEAEKALSSYDPKFKQGRIVFNEEAVQHLKNNPDRVKYIKQGGYSSAEAFLKDITENYDSIYENLSKGGEKRLLIAKAKKQAASLVLEVAPDGKGNYKVITAFPTNERYLSNKKLLWERRDTLSAEGSIKDAQARAVNSKDSIAENASQPPAQLTGSVKEIAENAAKSVGMSLDDILSAKGLKDGALDIQTNIKAVVNAERNEAGELLQKDAKLKSFDEVKGLLEGKALKHGEKLEEARQLDGNVRVEYAAEETGRSGRAVKVTKTGNAKIERTTFTPLGYQTTKDGGVLVKGYNENGHFTSYYLTESPNGGGIQTVGKITENAGFRGEYANPVVGQRTFKAEDVLGRGVRSENGFVKTSDAISAIKEAQQTASEVFDTISGIDGFPSLKRVLKKLKDGGSLTSQDMDILMKYTKNNKIKNAICDILGLLHAK